MDQKNVSESKQNDTILSFDTIYTTNEIQLLKLAVPLFCHDIQLLLATLIKAKELSYCYNLLQHTQIHSFSIHDDKIDQFLSCGRSYCNEQQLSLFDTMSKLRKTMKLLDKMQLLNINMPFDEPNDLSQLLLLLPQMMQSDQEGSNCHMGDNDTDSTVSCENNISNATTNEETINQNNIQNENGRTTAEQSMKNHTLLTNMLTKSFNTHQKEIFEKYMNQFSE